LEKRPFSEPRWLFRISSLCLLLSFVSAERAGKLLNGAPSTDSSLGGIVTDIVTGEPVGGVMVSVAGQSCVTDAEGRYSLDNLAPGIDRVEVVGDLIIPRSLMAICEGRTNLNITVKGSDFNNAMFWASAGKRERIMRWKVPPKWVVYSHVLDSDPPQEFAPSDRQYLFQIIRRELPAISPFFSNPEIELFKGRPNDDPRWTGKESADGFILCAPDKKGGGRANWHCSGGWVRRCTIRVNYRRAPKVWRHEIAHALGMAHAFDNEKWLPLGVKDPNYRPTKLHDGVEMYTDWDKLWLHCVYSGFRPAGNVPPDCDPNNFIHGRNELLVKIQPESQG